MATLSSVISESFGQGNKHFTKQKISDKVSDKGIRFSLLSLKLPENSIILKTGLNQDSIIRDIQISFSTTTKATSVNGGRSEKYSSKINKSFLSSGFSVTSVFNKASSLMDIEEFHETNGMPYKLAQETGTYLTSLTTYSYLKNRKDG